MPAKRANPHDSQTPRESKKTRSAPDAAGSEDNSQPGPLPDDGSKPLDAAIVPPGGSLPETARPEGDRDNNKVAAAADNSLQRPAALDHHIVRAVRPVDKVPPHLPTPDNSNIPANFRTYISEDLHARLNLLVHYTNEPVRIYAIGTLPQLLDWGPASGGADDLSSYVTIRDVPAKIWMTAEVKVPWFFSKSGAVLKRASICFLPLRSSDYERASMILTSFSKPHIDPPERNGIWAAKWLAGKDTPEEQVTEFDEVYDARTKLRAKRDMNKLEVSILKPNDIVLIEAVVRRYTPRDDDKGRTSKRKGWSHWRTTFELTSISLLCKAPDSLPTATDDSVDVEI